MWPPNVNDDETIDIKLPPKSDHIIILRRVENVCSFGLAYKVMPRQLSDSELIESAKNMEEQDDYHYFGEHKVFYKLFNSEVGACFWFENREENQVFSTEFELQLENLIIVGDEDSNTFAVTLQPGESAFKILRLVEGGQPTSIQMRYYYELDD